MDPRRWQRLTDLFERAREMSPGERGAWLDEHCDDDDLRRAVESMLAADADDSAVLERVVGEAVVDSGAAGAEDDAGGRGRGGGGRPDLAGRTVGAYRLIEEIGHGGMGSVWKAVRDDDAYTKEVAVKFMHRGLHSEELRARFRSERQILASLEHPGIARVVDGGTTDEGVPYVVMEHVEGLPIDRYCEAGRLTIRQRLELFCRVCEAVSFAHRNLVVHRDLKPGNVLVTPDGTPKLLDFGIAKLLDPAAAPHDVAETATAARLLTPEYASPEQVRGETITTASDVYSLGVMLYELLTGRRPYRLDGHTPGALERVICEEEPERPSTSVTREPDARHGDPATLRRALSGDLDNIVLMALRKEPARRYASADLLADDVRRHLDGLPVSARPATLGYRAAKFVGRHRAGVLATAAAVVVLVALTAFYTARLARERARAEDEARTNARVSEFLVGLFGSADPYETRGEEPTARQILDRGAARIDAGLSGEPAVRSRLLVTMARAYRNLEAWERSLELTDVALALQDELPGPRSAERAEILWAQGSALTSLARYDEARAKLRQALDAARRAHGPVHEDVALIVDALAVGSEMEGRYDDAGALYDEALEVALQLPGAPDNLAVADVRNLRGRLRTELGRYDEAIEEVSECVRIRAALLDEDAPEQAVCLNLLGSAYMGKGDYDAAEPVLTAALDIQRRAFGEDAHGTAYALSNLGNLYKYRGEPERALPLLERAVEIRRATVGEAHPAYATSLNNLANVQQDLGNLDESIALQREALAVSRAAFGEEHVDVATNLLNLASKLVEKGELEEAEALYRRTLELDRTLMGERHPYIAIDQANLADVLIRMGRRDEAGAVLRDALELQEGNPDVAPIDLASTLTTLGRLQTETGRLDEAEASLRRAVGLREEALAPDSVHLAIARNMLGGCLLAQGRVDEARALLEPSYAVLTAGLRPGHPSLEAAEERMARLRAADGSE